jgi:hypothetical protein
VIEKYVIQGNKIPNLPRAQEDFGEKSATYVTEKKNEDLGEKKEHAPSHLFGKVVLLR